MHLSVLTGTANKGYAWCPLILAPSLKRQRFFSLDPPPLLCVGCLFTRSPSLRSSKWPDNSSSGLESFDKTDKVSLSAGGSRDQQKEELSLWRSLPGPAVASFGPDWGQ